MVKDPYSDIKWVKSTPVIHDKDGKVIFKKEVEFPDFFRESDIKIVASKYLCNAAKRQETSLKQMVDRVSDTIADWGIEDGYFTTDQEADDFRYALKFYQAHQYFAFNSPVYFNVGLEEHPQASACFILNVEDDMDSITDWLKNESVIFKKGSGSGLNLSKIRGTNELVKGGGTASGPVSFLKGTDVFAGVIKCITGDSYIFTENGLMRMDDIIDISLDKGFHKSDISVVNQYGELERTSQVYVNGKSPIHNIQLSHTNINLKGTEEHPLLVMTPNFDMVWKKMVDIEIGDRVAVSRGMDKWSSSNVSFDFNPRLIITRQQISYPDVMTNDLARLMGYLVSEGSLENERYRTRFSMADKDVMDNFIYCFNKVFNVDINDRMGYTQNTKTGIKTYNIGVQWKGLKQFFEYCGLSYAKSGDKEIPWSILQSPKEIVIEFLRSLFEGDGHVGDRINYSSKSIKLVKQVQLMLLNIGIISKLHKVHINNVVYYRLDILGRDCDIFMKEIGFISNRKKNALIVKDRNTNNDVIPYLTGVLRDKSIGNGWFMCGDRKRCLKIDAMKSQSQHMSYDKSSQDGLFDIISYIDEGLSQTFKDVVNDNHFWDVVNGNDVIGDDYTYDFTLPETHSFVANGIVNHNSGGTLRRSAKLACLDMDHPDILNFINCKDKEELKMQIMKDNGITPESGYEMSDEVFFQNTNISVRINDEFINSVKLNGEWKTINRLDGEVHETFKAKELLEKIADHAWRTGDPGVQFHDNINKMNPVIGDGEINASNPCSEFMHLDNTSCNLASTNLKKFVDETGEFQTVLYDDVIKVVIMAQDILIDRAAYPIDEIEKNSKKYRPLGCGYANLGAMLMYLGMPYDSDEGRDMAALITAFHQGSAYRQSKHIASIKGAPKWWTIKNKKSMYGVLNNHYDSLLNVTDAGNRFENIKTSAIEIWQGILSDDEAVYNSQVSVLAPTGTISFLMGCDTQGIEPDFALVKFKTLSGSDGAVIKTVNDTIREALANRGYSDGMAEDIIRDIKNGIPIERQQAVKPRDKAIFDTANAPDGGTRCISYMGHLKMMAAVQPFLSGAISKTVNIPNSATVEDIYNIYLQSWEMGLKSVAIYRDGSKSAQILTTSEKDDIVEDNGKRLLPVDRNGMTHKFVIGGHTKGYITANEFEDGQLGEVFVNVARQGTTLSSIMDSFFTLTSICLQRGISLKDISKRMVFTNFSPAGFTRNPEIRSTSSLLDYIFRHLSLKYLSDEELIEIGLKTQDESINLVGNKKGDDTVVSDELCPSCGTQMRLLGTCNFCDSCAYSNGSCG